MAPSTIRNTPAIPKAGVIRGCIGSVSGSCWSAFAVALGAAVLEAVGRMVVLEECFAVDEGAADVEFRADVNAVAALED